MATPPPADPSARSSALPSKRSRPAPSPADPSSSAPSPSKRSRPAPPPVLRPSPSEPTRCQVITRVANPADAAASSAGAKEDDETEDRYFGAFTARFGVRHHAWADEVHKPQTAAEYTESLKTDQTTTCTSLAASHYQKDKGVVLEKIVGMDSHMFHLKWVSPDDRRLCCHVNFSASVVGGHRKSNFFFSEVIGTNSPQTVNTCVLLEKSDSSLQNCKFCSGMWHPMMGGFFGCKNLPPPG